VKPWCALIVCVFTFSSGAAKRDTIPTWLDTVPPVVRIQPKDTFHSSIFHVTLTANKPATIYFSVGYPQAKGKSEKKMETYREPLSVTDEGTTSIYFYGEDMFGNKSRVDSMSYVLDMRPPEITVTPEPGRYRVAPMIRCQSNKPVKFFFQSSLIDTISRPLPDTFKVKDSLVGYIIAMDRAGNRTASKRLTYVVDSTTIQLEITPKEGIYNKKKYITFTSHPFADVYYTFDPSAPPTLFSRFDKPVQLPYGNTIVRFYAKNKVGWESNMTKANFIVDTIPPKLHFEQGVGPKVDTLFLSTKEPTTIRYTLDGSFPTAESPLFNKSILVPKKGKCSLKAVAKDLAGNASELFEWTFKYDKTPPVITVTPRSGVFNAPFRVVVGTNKPSSVYYTLDGDSATQKSVLYKDGIQISKEGTTALRLIAVDEADNVSAEVREAYTIDTRPPSVKLRVEEDIQKNAFIVTMTADEEATIRYEIDGMPTASSPVYSNKISLRMGQVLRYVAVDRAGNRTEVKTMEELKKPMVAIMPEGGLYNKPVRISFATTQGNSVFWHILPDSGYGLFKDSLVLDKEANYTLEYFSESHSGLRSPIRRSEYLVDLSPPQTQVIVKKGVGDSVSVFFECSKNATIYYTLDGTNPRYSGTARTAGSKYYLSSDRISVKRKAEVKLAFFAEDAAGNQSSVRVIDVFKPRAVPDVPSGADRRYDHILSVTLNSYDSKSTIYFARHGRAPTLDSAVFSTPLTLVTSDTILAFVVDASGYRGQLDTFVYLIDLPPSPEFSFSPATMMAGTSVTFDASKSIDLETPLSRLQFRWDFTGDGTFAGGFSSDPRAVHSFMTPGIYRVTLEVQDEKKHKGAVTKEVLVRTLCPAQMVSLTLESGATFCIDKYEWPNISGERPTASVSWVQAKMFCMDAGKRLCTQEEWVTACRGMKKTVYPYGPKYEQGRCPAEGDASHKSGRFPRCGEEGGPQDMVGNVWEWVEDKRGDYPLMLGGSFRFGENADCQLSTEGSVGAKSGEVGFRCCK
jgi:PKD repeat protein